jgi:hypothetical protein
VAHGYHRRDVDRDDGVSGRNTHEEFCVLADTDLLVEPQIAKDGRGNAGLRSADRVFRVEQVGYGMDAAERGKDSDLGFGAF